MGTSNALQISLKLQVRLTLYGFLLPKKYFSLYKSLVWAKIRACLIIIGLDSRG